MRTLEPVSEFPQILSDVASRAIESTLASIFGETPIMLDAPDEPCHGPSVAGIMSFTGDRNWILTLVLPEATAPAVAYKFAGFEVPFESGDMGDVVGELTNVVAGDVIAQLEAKSIKVAMSLPTVARGADIDVHLPSNIPTRRLDYASSLGRLWFKLAISPAASKMCRLPGR
jgi:chemotaxis protein CheX